MTTSDKIKMYYWSLLYQHTKSIRKISTSLFFFQSNYMKNKFRSCEITLLISKGNPGKPIGVLASWNLLKPQDGSWFEFILFHYWAALRVFRKKDPIYNLDKNIKALKFKSEQ